MLARAVCVCSLLQQAILSYAGLRPGGAARAESGCQEREQVLGRGLGCFSSQGGKQKRKTVTCGLLSCTAESTQLLLIQVHCTLKAASSMHSFTVHQCIGTAHLSFAVLVGTFSYRVDCVLLGQRWLAHELVSQLLLSSIHS